MHQVFYIGFGVPVHYANAVVYSVSHWLCTSTLRKCGVYSVIHWLCTSTLCKCGGVFGADVGCVRLETDELRRRNGGMRVEIPTTRAAPRRARASASAASAATAVRARRPANYRRGTSAAAAAAASAAAAAASAGLVPPLRLPRRRRLGATARCSSLTCTPAAGAVHISTHLSQSVLRSRLFRAYHRHKSHCIKLNGA